MFFMTHVQHALLKEYCSFLWRVTLALSLCEGCVSVVSACEVCVSYSHTRAHKMLSAIMFWILITLNSYCSSESHSITHSMGMCDWITFRTENIHDALWVNARGVWVLWVRVRCVWVTHTHVRHHVLVTNYIKYCSSESDSITHSMEMCDWMTFGTKNIHDALWVNARGVWVLRVSVRCVWVTQTHVRAHHTSGSITDIDVDDETGVKLYHITYDDGDEEG